MSAAHPRLFLKIYLHGLLLLVVVAVAVSLLVFASGHIAPWREFSQRYARVLSAQAADVLSSPAEAERMLRVAGDPPGIAMTLYRLDGGLIASNVAPPIAPLEPGEVGRLGPEPLSVRHGHRALALPVLVDGKPAGYLLVGMRDAPQASRGLIGLAVVLVALAFGSFPLARAIARPLERITETAQQLGAGDLSVRSGIRRRDEVGRLSEALDEMADRLEALIRGERELLANVSHELRTPLARIRVALEMAREGDPAAAQRYLGEVGTDLGELERMLEDVFTAARLDLAAGSGGGPPLRRERVDASEIVERAAARFREQHPGRALEVDVVGALPIIDADPALLRRVIDNLLDNARKYSPAESPVALVARAEGDALTLEVRDRGIGIDAADLPRLFTPFFRTDRSRARGTGGVGLGLTLARRIVEAHGGTISAESAAGQGTTIRVRLPLRREDGGDQPRV